MSAKPRPVRPFIDLSEPFANLLRKLGCTVHTAGEALVSADGEPYLDMWTVEFRGAAKAALKDRSDWDLALLTLAGVVQENAAE